MSCKVAPIEKKKKITKLQAQSIIGENFDEHTQRIRPNRAHFSRPRSSSNRQDRISDDLDRLNTDYDQDPNKTKKVIAKKRKLRRRHERDVSNSLIDNWTDFQYPIDYQSPQRKNTFSVLPFFNTKHLKAFVEDKKVVEVKKRFDNRAHFLSIARFLCNNFKWEEKCLTLVKN
ncbi:MAG: hypothetical protein ACOYL6_16370 [Bacteriovoracaceae bacterium]